MECVIVQRLPHTRLPAMLQAQKKALDSRIRQYSKSHVAHQGLTAFQEGCRRVDISSIPGQRSVNSHTATTVPELHFTVALLQPCMRAYLNVEHILQRLCETHRSTMGPVQHDKLLGDVQRLSHSALLTSSSAHHVFAKMQICVKPCACCRQISAPCRVYEIGLWVQG